MAAGAPIYSRWTTSNIARAAVAVTVRWLAVDGRLLPGKDLMIIAARASGGRIANMFSAGGADGLSDPRQLEEEDQHLMSIGVGLGLAERPRTGWGHLN